MDARQQGLHHVIHHVIITQTPLGMEVQTGCMWARVLDVWPDYPAHAGDIRKGFVLVRINDQPVSGETWHEVFLNTELPFSLTFITEARMPLAHVPGVDDTEVHFIVRSILTGVTRPDPDDIKSNSMMRFLSQTTDGPVILLDGSGPGVVDIFSLGAVVWKKLRGHMSKHYCGISLEHDPLGLGQAASGHIGEALALAIVLGSIFPRIQFQGGMLAAVVMDSLNFASNLTTTEPSDNMDKVLRLLAHELAGHQEILVINREAYGRFAQKKIGRRTQSRAARRSLISFVTQLPCVPRLKRAKPLCISHNSGRLEQGPGMQMESLVTCWWELWCGQWVL